MVEPQRDVPGQLHVLDLVLAHGDLVGVVEQDVGGHEHRVVEQPGADRLLALALLLELGHPPQLTHGGHAVEDPGQLGDDRHMALDEEDAALRVEPGGEEQRSEPAGLGGEVGRVVRGGHGVEVDDGRRCRRPGPAAQRRTAPT